MSSETLKKLFERHNLIVKPRYMVDDMNAFEDYLDASSFYDKTLRDGANYIEITSNKTRAGKPVILNWD